MMAGSSLRVTNGQAVLRTQLDKPTDPANPGDSWSNFSPWWEIGSTRNWRITFRPGRTVELRTDWIEANQDDAVAGVLASSGIEGYGVGLGRNEVLLLKYGSIPMWFNSYFFWERVALPETRLTLSAAFTQVGPDLEIRVRVLGSTSQNLLWEKTVFDTAGRDDVLPNLAVKGILMQPEGNPAPYVGLQMIPHVGVGYLNTERAPVDTVEVTIDNFEVREFPARSNSAR